MKNEQWNIIKKCANMQSIDPQPIGLIIDSPWMPGYLGISMMDYYTMPEVWLEANLKVEQDFPDVVFLPGFWAEIGMCVEPSGFGCRTRLFHDRTPMVFPVIQKIEEVGQLPVPNPLTDGLMPFMLNLYRNIEPRVNDAGHVIKVVAARGPMATAAHIVGVTNFLISIKINPKETHQLLRLTTDIAKDWLEAQANVLQDVEGVLLLDDIVGFLGEDDYLEFGHPYFSEIFSAFPDSIKLFHNDMDNTKSFKYLREWPINIFNFSHKIDLTAARELVGPDICLMGNVPPLEALMQGSLADVWDTTKACLGAHPQEGLLLSAGGGVSPGTPGENIQALVNAARS